MAEVLTPYNEDTKFLMNQKRNEILLKIEHEQPYKRYFSTLLEVKELSYI
jgi:hypothetical protein